MTLKTVGGVLCALALAAIFYFHTEHKQHEAAPVPVPVVKVEAPVPVPLPTPSPLKVAPTPKVVVVQPIKPAVKKPLDMSVSCRIARNITAGKTPQQLKDMREHYGTSDEEIARYKHCF